MNTQIILATGYPEMDKVITNKYQGFFKSFDVIKAAKTRKDLLEYILSSKTQPCDIIVFSDSLRGKEITVEVITQIKLRYPSMRIVYLCLPVEKDNKDKLEMLGRLVMLGVHDINAENTFSPESIQSALMHAKSYEEVKHFAEPLMQRRESTPNIQIEAAKPKPTESNIFAISSIKPGSGKSFFVSNIAAGIAQNGIPINGKPPRVAVIEGDLQNLSVGALLAMEWNDKYNLQTVLEEISTVVTSQGVVSTDVAANKKVKDFILKAMLPYKYCPNLFVLNGSECDVELLTKTANMHYYTYLLDTVKQYFDIVIVDTNSSLYHETTLSILSKAQRCYYIIEADYNIVLNNQNYLKLLKKCNIMDKVRFIINQDINKHNMRFEGGDFELPKFTSDDLNGTPFETKLRVPKVPTTIMKNRVTDGIPLILDENKEHTRRAQYALLEIADEIWKIRNLGAFLSAIQKEDVANKKRLFGGRRNA